MTGDTGIQGQVPNQARGEVAVSTLSIIGNVLMETIHTAHLAIEDCVDGRGGSAALVRAGELLRQVRGALRITETYGAALLAEEMELGCKYLAGLQPGKGRDDGLDALTRSMVQLPVYIERLLGGGRDIALVLLPLLNDLRAARGEPLLSEGTLLLLNVSPGQVRKTSTPRQGSGEDPVVLSSRLRPKFQLALLGWIKGGNTQQHLEALANVAARFEKAATRDDMHDLWWVAGAVLESLREGGLETSVALKRLLGQADRQIKHVIDEGVDVFDAHPVDDLLNNLLYYVARSSTGGQRVSEIRAAFNLSESLPGDEQVERARESLSAPSVKLMKTVASAIKEDLAGVKDVLDIFVRTGMKNSSELVPQLELLKKISDTLGVLGLGELRGDVDGEINRLKSVVERGGIADDQIILDIASTLLRVEDRLDQQLLRLIAPQQQAEGDQAPDLPPEEAADYRHVAEAVMRECIINLARIKEAVGQSLESKAPSQGLDSVPSLIRGIKAGLMMLDKTRAMEVVDRIGSFIALTVRSGGSELLSQRETDRLADAIVSIEYYMETVKAGRSEPWYMLDNAEACLMVLRDIEHRLAQDDSAESRAAMSQDAADEQAATATAYELQQTAVLPLPVVAANTEHIDPELLELFIEEAKEEVVSIKRKLPAWQEAPDDFEMLISVRRSFHTLKGSGRMVGAERIGEYCWSVEGLLNRLINHTLVCTPPMVDFVVEAAAAVPELIEQLEIGTEPTADIGLLMARARAFAQGDPNAAVLRLVAGTEQAAAEAPPALEMDPVLLDIFSRETAGHLQVITDYLSACEERRAPFEVTDKLHRACHTLHGSANMANVDRGVAVSGALNRLVRRVYDFKVGFEESGLAALREAVESIKAIVADINQPDRTRADYGPLVDHLTELADALQPEHLVDEEKPAAGIAVYSPQDEEVVAEPVAQDVEYDAEIAAIFTEEAAELLEMADKALAEWSQNRQARQPVEELKRYLHTLKGGARMAGITAMGDFSHELETLLISIDEGRVTMTPVIDDLLQQSLDDLHRMRDAVIAGKPAVVGADLGQRIERVNAGFEIVEDIGIAAPVAEEELEQAETAEFTAEPEDSISMAIVDTPLADEPEWFTEREESGDTPSELLADLAGYEFEAEAEIEPGLERESVQGFEPEPEPEPEFEREPEPEFESAIELTDRQEPETEQELEAEQELAAEQELEPGPGAEFERQLGEAAEPARPAARPAARQEQRPEFARIDADLLEDLLNAAGEISIYHSRLTQQVGSFGFHVDELEQTISRLREQLRKLEIETEAQIIHGHHDTLAARDFDPLEMDRYSNIQQLTRALAESSNDLTSLKDLLQSVTTEADALLVQQSRVTAELQDGLMRTRMVTFERHVPRLTRLVRQIASEAGKAADLAVEGASGELDRQVLDKMLPPFEHMLRNAIVHGIETTEERQKAGKPATGRITIRLHREGAEMVIDIADDGKGLDVDAIRRKAYEQDLLKPDAKVSDEEIMSLILTPGFSTAGIVTQSAGRGVGMDVVVNEVKKLGGSLRISSVTGQGTNFTVRLPFTLAITQALIVRTGEEVYALPLPSVDGVARIPRAELESLLSRPEPSYEHNEQTYKFRHLGMYLGGQAAQLSEDAAFIPVILVRAGDYSAALLTDEMLASREIVVKSVGPQLASIRGIAGATILGDGRVVLILDIVALVRTGAPVVELNAVAPKAADERPVALVVDDSITVRRVTERLLQRNGMRVVTAKDGLDAISVLRETKPDIIILDIEMPRMDGYEFASHVRNDHQVADVPIIMVTSRVGDKHRAKAIELGVNDYLGKPYQDSQMLAAIERLLDERGIKLS
jgi:chemosensory pili system protein ChpA (sensor histidine kinase/response regulator)